MVETCSKGQVSWMAHSTTQDKTDGGLFNLGKSLILHIGTVAWVLRGRHTHACEI